MGQDNLALALLVALALAACGGSTGGDQTLKTRFSAQVTFGDSLSDVGTYAVGTVAAIGGGQFTINGDNTSKAPALTGKNWTELMAAQFGLPAPCAAQTGLEGDASLGFAVPVANHPNCFGYAQGSARVTNPIGPYHKLTGSPIGMLTVPVATQIANHLALSGGKFKGDEIVFVLAGGSDVFMQLGQLGAGASAAGTAEGARVGAAAFAGTLVGLLASGAADPASAAQAIGPALQREAARAGHTEQTVVAAAVGAAADQPGNSAVASPAVHGPMVSQAQTAAAAAGNAAGAKAAADYASANAALAVGAVAGAGAELATLLTTQIVGKGANHVVVGSLPDLGAFPSARKESGAGQALVKAMVAAFNDQLRTGTAGQAKILYVDLYSVTHDQITNPGPYGLTNTTEAACGANPLGSAALGCNGSNLIGGDVSHYMFADDVHPTPFESLLTARFVALQMAIKGWL
ncbi:MAG: SGNH/GDSL hydrolase family protein [Telluria sp.]|nr:SGNH/GDSL hydrolase family protein [Telluria sp.]